MEEIRKALEDAQGQIATLTSEKKQLLENIKNQKQEISTKEKHIMQAEEEVKKHKLLVEEADKNVKVAKGNAEHLIKSKKGQLVAAERNLGKAQRELKDVKAQHELCAKKIEDFKVAETRKDGEIAKLKKEIEGTEEQVGLHQALEDWKEHQGCAQDIMKLEDDLSDFKEKHKKLKENLQACEAKLRDSEAEKKTLTRATKAQKDKIGRMQKDIDALQNHLKTFEVMQANFNILQYKINALEAARPPPSDIDEVSSFSEDGQKFTPRPLCQELGISSQADSDASAGGTAPEDEVDPQIKSMIENRPKIIPRLKGKIAFSGLTSATGGKITGGETAVASKVAVGQVFNMTKAQRGDVILRVNELPPEKNEEAIKMIHENMKFEVRLNKAESLSYICRIERSQNKN